MILIIKMFLFTITFINWIMHLKWWNIFIQFIFYFSQITCSFFNQLDTFTLEMFQTVFQIDNSVSYWPSVKQRRHLDSVKWKIKLNLIISRNWNIPENIFVQNYQRNQIDYSRIQIQVCLKASSPWHHHNLLMKLSMSILSLALMLTQSLSPNWLLSTHFPIPHHCSFHW